MEMSLSLAPVKIEISLRFEPHKLIEGCLIASYAVQAHVCYIYIRGEYFIDGAKTSSSNQMKLTKKINW